MTARIGLAVFAATTMAAMVTSSAATAADIRREGPEFAQRIDEASAAYRHKRHVRRYAPRAYVYRAPVYATPRGYARGADPAFSPSGMLYQRPYDPGGCIIDEGYGRFTSCSNR